MTSMIHPMACVSPNAKLGENVRVDAFAVIEDDVVIGDNCHIHSHAKIAQYTTMGANCRVYLGALVGEQPQDHRCDPKTVSYTEIGHDTVIREYVQIHRPPFEGKKTVIGNHCLFMGFVHIAHDCQIADNVTIANNTALSGHIEVGPGAVISGYVIMHQFCRIGALAMMSPLGGYRQDVPPFCITNERGAIVGMNSVGLKRAGYDVKTRSAVNRAIKTYYFSAMNKTEALEKIMEEDGTIPQVAYFVQFIRESKRGVMPSVVDQDKNVGNFSDRADIVEALPTDPELED